MEHARVIAKNSQCGQCDGGNRHGELVLEDILGDSGRFAGQKRTGKGDNNGDAQGKRHAGQGQVGGQVHGTETGQRHETVYYIKKHGQCQREQERGEEVARKDEGRIRIDHNGKDRSYHTDGCGADKEGAKRELRHEQFEKEEGQERQSEQPDEHEAAYRAGDKAGMGEEGFGADGKETEIQEDNQAEAGEGG